MTYSVNWPAVEWVLLDMDGTVLDLAYDNYFWRELVPQRYAALQGIELEHARAELAPKFAAVQHTLPWYCTDYWSRTTGLNMAALKHEVRHRIGVLPGVERFLATVRASGRQLWLATNAHPDSWRLKLAHTGLAAQFDRIVCSHDFGAPKESAEFWSALHASHPFDRTRTLFVDDSAPVLAAARQFGIAQVVGLRQPDSSQPERDLPGFDSAKLLADLTPGADGVRSETA